MDGHRMLKILKKIYKGCDHEEPLVTFKMCGLKINK